VSIHITFDRDRARHILGTLLDDRPVSPGPPGWDHDALLQLAGACLYLAASREADRRGVDWSAVHPEHGEAAVGTLFDELLAAAEWCCHAAMPVAGGQYDGELEARQRAVVSSVDGKMVVTFPEGRKGG
jgi:hypothetical protein